jgi:hypothetical protein
MNFTLSNIPAALGGWDSPATQRALATSQRQRDEDAAERAAQCEQIESEIHFALAAEEKGVLHFVPRQPTAIAAVIEGLDHDDLMDQMAKLLVDVAGGRPMQAHAADLLRKAVACFADDRVDE